MKEAFDFDSHFGENFSKFSVDVLQEILSMEMDGTFDLATLANMESSDVPFLGRTEPFWRKCDSYESILYDLLSVENQVNAQNGDHLKPNQYFWHYIQDVDTDGNIRHFAVNNPEEPVLKEAEELPVDDAGTLVTVPETSDVSGSFETGPLEESMEQPTVSANDSGASVDPSADEVQAGRMAVTRRRSRRLEEADQIGQFCREIGIQLEDVQRPGFIGGFKLPAQLMTMGVVMELADYLKRHGHPRSQLIRCLEHLFNVNHFNWESPQFVSRFNRLLRELTAERNQLKRKRMDMTPFYSLPFIVTADGSASRRILSLEQDVFSLKKQLERLSQRLFRFQKLVKRSRTRWNAF